MKEHAGCRDANHYVLFGAAGSNTCRLRLFRRKDKDDTKKYILGLRMRTVSAVSAILVLTLIIASAGCITTGQTINPLPAELPASLNSALDEFVHDLGVIERELRTETENLSDAIRTAEDAEVRKQLVKQYYAENPSILSVVFHDAATDAWLSVPVMLNIDIQVYSLNLTEQDFIDAGGFIVKNNVFTRYHGYVNLYCNPVYLGDGTYRGYLVFVTNYYTLLYHSPAAGLNRSYGQYAGFITDAENQIIYSSIEEAIGKSVSSGYYDGMVYISKETASEGAYTYTSRSFAVSCPDKTEKVTAWRRMAIDSGKMYTLYLTEELNAPAVQMNNLTVPDAKTAVDTAREAFVYAETAGLAACINRINSGYYDVPVSMVNMNGTVIASSEPYRAGNNYLNNRGTYGYSYMGTALHLANQGGGFVYYTMPVEPVIFPQAALFMFGNVVPVDDDCFIYVPFAGSGDAVSIDYAVRADMTAFVHTLLWDISTEGREAVNAYLNENRYAAIKAIAPNLTTTFDDAAILNMKGEVYASVKHPDLVGESSTFKVDKYGGSATRLAILLAKTGGGFMAVLKQSPGNPGYVDLCLTAVEPIDDEYYMYVSAYLATFRDVLSPYLD
ncbi:MAG: hypothetical protein Q4Q04_01270 [Methanocorpusculum sp.]|nr:hypothetical protein [Methanocorpusculum sp.]